MKLKTMTSVIILNKDMLKKIKSGFAPDCEEGFERYNEDTYIPVDPETWQRYCSQFTGSKVTACPM